ncbi:DUF2934 domain-containing protein [Rhodoblastus sp.]|uniref:DUF2934 domain-containing protein n=1 Tax=Rhodoblastus sp. TaxID=1962975 RepID=UPI003F95A512
MPAPAARRSASSKAAAPAKRATPAKRQIATKKPAPGPSAPRDAVIARLAYFFAEARGFAPGKELEDWLAAEAHYETMPEMQRVAAL